jgi:predicted GNAT superfamily acetyltransferase
MSDITIRDLTSIEEFRQVVECEKAIWGYTDQGDLVTVPVFIFTVHRGATLIGAFDTSTPPAPSASSEPWPGQLVGFAYAVVGMKHGKPMLWSHMTGVLPEFRGGLGFELKLAQRGRALAQGYDLIEWTFDPMQAMNAHFNFAKLGVVVEEYEENFYGTSTSPLHQGNPTDRFVAEWWIRTPHVERRLVPTGPLTLRAIGLADTEQVNRTAPSGEWLESVDVDLSLGARRLLVEIPMGFTDMLSRAPELALAWRICTRAIFTTYFARGYRAVDFILDRAARKGAYLLARE